MAKRKTVEAILEGDAGVVVRPKVNFDWSGALKKAREEHWHKIRITIQLRRWLMAGKPAQLDAAKAMLKARGLEAAIEAVDTRSPTALAEAAAEVQDEGLCEFHRRPGMTGVWFPTNHIKAGLKENWSVCGYRMEHRGSRGAFAEGTFVYAAYDIPPKDTEELNWIKLSDSQELPIYTGVSHTTGPKGPVSAIKRHEYVERPQLTFDVAIAQAVVDKVPFEAFADMLVHFGEHGLGACRSQGYGQFDVLDVKDLSA